MAKLIKLSNNSWKQPFNDRKKEMDLWNTHTIVASICGLKDGTKRKLNIKFEDKFNIDITDYFQITSGKEIAFPKSIKDRIGSIVIDNPDSFFIVTVLDSYDFTFTPSDIIWIKNVTNKKGSHAYMELTTDIFTLHFPNKSGDSKNLLSPKINDIILLRQVINKVPVFTHLVTPIDDLRVEDDKRSEYRYGREVRIIAKTELNSVIPVSSTLWNKINFQGISHGNVCEIENISSVENVDKLKLNIWNKFGKYFISSEEQSATITSSIITELEDSNPDLSVTEGELRLVSHIVKERNREIVKEKKQLAINNNSLKCEVCTFSFPKTYQSNFIECHHILPIGESGVRKTKLEDLALVCANCHRMLHVKFEGKYLTIDQLKKRIISLK